MARKQASCKPKSLSSIQEFLGFVEAHRDARLDEAERDEMFALDLKASMQCAKQHISVPLFGYGDRTPGMKLNYGRTSIYEYPGNLELGGSGTVPDYLPLIPVPDDDWLVWLRSVAETLSPRPEPRPIRRTSKKVADIHELDEVVLQKIRDAVKYAVDTWDRNGEPDVLPRCNQKDVGMEVGLSETTTSRRFAAPEAEELRAHWEVLADREKIVELAANKRERNP